MISILQLVIIFHCVQCIFSQRMFHNPKTSQKYIDIYTNYPNLEEVIKEEKYADIFTKNKSGQDNPSNSDFRSNFRPAWVKLQSEKYIDPDYDDEIDQSTESHVQKIQSRSLSTSNSKRLETNENFFSKINSVIRNQFSRLFKFGGQDNDVVKDTPKAYENSRSPAKDFGEDTEAKKRFLNLFTVLQFPNSRCTTQAGAMTYEGTCFHRIECQQKGGINMGACAKGYGVCCVFRYTCGGYTNANTSYFECDNGGTPVATVPTTMPTTLPPAIDPRVNISALLNRFQQNQMALEFEWGRPDDAGGAEGRQNTATSTCVFTVAKRRADVRQLRIDFEDFDIRGPTNGSCNADRLVISGNNINMQIPVICGYNTGQHIYVDVSDVTGPIQLSVFSANPAEKRFRIKVSQIRAPCANFMNCLQYYTGLTGTVQTFNYNPSPRGLGPAQYFNNLNYAICIKKEPGYCTITYSNVQNGVASPFRLINVDANGNTLIPPGQAGVEIFNCPDDYIVINGIRLCGDILNDGSTNADFRQNAAVTDTSGGPFVLPVRTNGNTVARGFQLFYTQNRCA